MLTLICIFHRTKFSYHPINSRVSLGRLGGRCQFQQVCLYDRTVKFSYPIRESKSTAILLLCQPRIIRQPAVLHQISFPCNVHQSIESCRRRLLCYPIWLHWRGICVTYCCPSVTNTHGPSSSPNTHTNNIYLARMALKSCARALRYLSMPYISYTSGGSSTRNTILANRANNKCTMDDH